MPEWLVRDQFLNSRKVYHGDNFDHDPNTVSTYDDMGTPTPTGWSPIFPTAGGEVNIEERSQQLLREH